MLLIAVLVIWGYFIISLVSDLGAEDKFELNSIANPSENPIKAQEKESFSLIDNLRDPFLDKATSYTAKKSNASVVHSNRKDWPSVIYKGQISGSESSARYVLAINGKEQLLKLGQTVNEVRLLRANEKEATIRFEGQSKVILIQ